MSQAYKKYFGNYSAAVLAVGGENSLAHHPAVIHASPAALTVHRTLQHDEGDQTANLWWRLQNGEIFIKHAPQVSVVLIGTNDLGAASCGVGEPGIQAAVGGVVSRYDALRTCTSCMHVVDT